MTGVSLCSARTRGTFREVLSEEGHHSAPRIFRGRFVVRAALNAALDRYAIDHDIKVYPDAHHSFFNAQGRAYNKPAAEGSWDRVMAFFGKHLGESTSGPS